MAHVRGEAPSSSLRANNLVANPLTAAVLILRHRRDVKALRSVKKILEV
jgi:hypothetical protein